MSIIVIVSLRNRKNGLITEFESHSYTRAFLDILAAHFGESSVSTPDIANVLQDTYPGGIGQGWMSIGSSTRGLLVGTDPTAYAMTDYSLGTQITDGTGSGQLEFGVNVINTPTTVGGTRRILVVREFTNNSGGGVTVRETGCVALCWPNDFLIWRDAPVTHVIPDGDSATLTYNVSVTV